jgi:hypothetical protein
VVGFVAELCVSVVVVVLGGDVVDFGSDIPGVAANAAVCFTTC